jgi:hypothetical protein
MTIAKQQRAKTLSDLITLTSILSQGERRPFLPLGEGRDEGFGAGKIDNVILGLRRFSQIRAKLISLG